MVFKNTLSYLYDGADVMLSFQGELGADGSAMGIYLSFYSLETWWCPDFRVWQGQGQHCGFC